MRNSGATNQVICTNIQEGVKSIVGTVGSVPSPMPTGYASYVRTVQYFPEDGLADWHSTAWPIHAQRRVSRPQYCSGINIPHIDLVTRSSSWRNHPVCPLHTPCWSPSAAFNENWEMDNLDVSTDNTPVLFSPAVHEPYGNFWLAPLQFHTFIYPTDGVLMDLACSWLLLYT